MNVQDKKKQGEKNLLLTVFVVLFGSKVWI